MGMSGDFEWRSRRAATLIRVGQGDLRPPPAATADRGGGMTSPISNPAAEITGNYETGRKCGAGLSGRVITLSTIWPSRSVTIRSPYDAAISLWVTRTTVTARS